MYFQLENIISINNLFNCRFLGDIEFLPNSCCCCGHQVVALRGCGFGKITPSPSTCGGFGYSFTLGVNNFNSFLYHHRVDMPHWAVCGFSAGKLGQLEGLQQQYCHSHFVVYSGYPLWLTTELMSKLICTHFLLWWKMTDKEKPEHWGKNVYVNQYRLYFQSFFVKPNNQA